MEEKFDTIISLLETQNKAWQKSLQILDGIYTVLSNQYMKDERLLQEHPAIREPAADQPVSVGGASQPRPFNEYTDNTPYGVELEEERAGVPQSFPATQPQAPVVSREQVVSHETPPTATAASETNAPSEQVVAEPPTQSQSPLPPVTSKAEMLERAVRMPEA